MTLEEAIVHCEEVAQKKEQLLEIHRKALVLMPVYSLTAKQEQECIKCAEDHRQLAEWLKELQILRKGGIIK
jgi:hypothetical protein